MLFKVQISIKHNERSLPVPINAAISSLPHLRELFTRKSPWETACRLNNMLAVGPVQAETVPICQDSAYPQARRHKIVFFRQD